MGRSGWGGCALESGGSWCHRRRGFQSTIRPACPFGPGLSAPWAGSRLRTLTTDVHSRSAFHPPLGRLRSGAPRLWPLSPELHTADCSFACPGSSTWVDKVPSRDTPTLDLSDCQDDPDRPQVARNQSRNGGALMPASTSIERRPEQPSVKAVSSVSSVWPTAARPRRIRAAIDVSVFA